jgi:hypothetical protein
MISSTRVTRRPVTTGESTRVYLRLTRLLDDVELTHPDVSGPLRLTLVRAHRGDRVGWLDEARFREVVADLVASAPASRRRGRAAARPADR